jgi:hypothetical protein
MQKPGAAYTSLRKKFRTFDMIAYRGGDLYSDAISRVEVAAEGRAAAGQYTHVGLVVDGRDLPRGTGSPLSYRDELYVFESTLSTAAAPRLEGGAFLGVQLRRLDEVVADYDSNERTSLHWCALRAAVRPRLSPEQLAALLRRYNGRRYDANPLELFAAAFRPLRWLRRLCDGCCGECCCECCRGASAQFCSELVTNMYRDSNVLERSINPRDVIPADYFEGGLAALHEPAVTFTAYPAWF